MILQHIGVRALTALLEYFPFPAYSSLREIDHLVVFLVVPPVDKNTSMPRWATLEPSSRFAQKTYRSKGWKGFHGRGGYYDRYYRRNFDSSSFFKSGEKRKRKKQRSHFYDSRRTIEFLLFIPEKREKIVFLEIVSLLSS